MQNGPAPDTARTRRLTRQITLEKGIVLQIEPVTTLIVQKLQKKYERDNPPPRVPTFYIAEKDREEENPNDPDYLDAVNAYNTEFGLLSARVYACLGSSVVSIPTGVSGPDDDGWANQLVAVGVLDADEIPPSGYERYGLWFLYYATSSHDEALSITQYIMRQSGLVPEGDVATAESTFRGDTVRDTAAGIPTEAEVPERSGISD